MFERFPALGRIMSLTRNAHAVHERKGIFEYLRIGEQMGLVLGKEIDLRLIFKNWVYAYSVTDVTETRTLRSFQFYDAYGEAVYKLYATEDTDLAVWQQVVQDFLDVHQDAGEEVLTHEPTDSAAQAFNQDNHALDVQAFHADWARLTDVHQFFPMLKRYGISRLAAMRYAPEGSVTEVRADSAFDLFHSAQSQALPIMIFVGNRGCVQIHTGPINRIVRMKEWLNILDPDFNLHLLEGNIHSAWVVRRPSDSGQITCVDYFDEQGNLIMSVFGKRIEQEPELPQWQALAEQMAHTHCVVGKVA